MNERMLTERQALRAMFLFLQQYYERGKSKDVLLLMHSVDTENAWQDGKTNDPAAEDDWRRCVDLALASSH
jgi:hypothetical protein